MVEQESMMSDTLRGCPFCGSEAAGPLAGRAFVIKCSGCYARIPEQDTPEKAVTVWNTRAQTSEILENFPYFDEQAFESAIIETGGNHQDCNLERSVVIAYLGYLPKREQGEIPVNETTKISEQHIRIVLINTLLDVLLGNKEANAVVACLRPFLRQPEREIVDGWQPIETAPKDISISTYGYMWHPKTKERLGWTTFHGEVMHSNTPYPLTSTQINVEGVYCNYTRTKWHSLPYSPLPEIEGQKP